MIYYLVILEYPIHIKFKKKINLIYYLVIFQDFVYIKLKKKMTYYLIIFQYSIHLKLNKVKHDILSCNLQGFYIYKIKLK